MIDVKKSGQFTKHSSYTYAGEDAGTCQPTGRQILKILRKTYEAPLQVIIHKHTDVQSSLVAFHFL